MIDRIVIREGVRDRLAESINLAVHHGDGARAGRIRRKTQKRQPMARPAFQHSIRLPQLQNQLRGIGAPHVQFQQPLRSLSKMRRAGRAGRIRRGTCPARLELVAGRRGSSALERRIGGGHAKNPTPPAPFFIQDRHPLEHALGKTFGQISRSIALTAAARGSKAF